MVLSKLTRWQRLGILLLVFAILFVLVVIFGLQTSTGSGGGPSH